MHLIHIPRWAPYLFFIIAYGSWSFISVLVGASLGYSLYIPGSPTCELSGNETYTYLAVFMEIYILIFAVLVFIILISIRLVRVKVKSRVSWKIVIAKQMRIFFFWGTIAFNVIIFTTFFVLVNISLDVENLIKQFMKYRICVLLAGDDEDCELEFSGAPDYYMVLVANSSLLLVPTITFMVFGLRKDMLKFWKEYFVHAWKHKRLMLQFVPSSDPSSTSAVTVNSLDDMDKIEQLRKRIREL